MLAIIRKEYLCKKRKNNEKMIIMLLPNTKAVGSGNTHQHDPDWLRQIPEKPARIAFKAHYLRYRLFGHKEQIAQICHICHLSVMHIPLTINMFDRLTDMTEKIQRPVNKSSNATD